MGIKMVLYLDDGIITSSHSESLKRQVSSIQHDLASCGFLVNEQKSLWEPTQNLEWLGIIIDLKNLTFDTRKKFKERDESYQQ